MAKADTPKSRQARQVSELPATPEGRRTLLDEMSEIHDTLDGDGLVLFSDLATQVAIDDDLAAAEKSEEINETREVL